MRKKTSWLLVTPLVVVGLIGMAPVAAYADDSPAKDTTQYTPDQNSVPVPQSSPSSGGMHTNTTIPEGNGSPAGHLSDDQKASAHPSGGSSSTIETGFNTTVTFGGSGTSAAFSGTSFGRWNGSSPFNASSIGLTDYVSDAAIGVSSVNISSNPSIGLTVTGSEIKYSNTVNNNYKNTHSFSGWKFSGALLSVTEDSQVVARFGSATFIKHT